jgi:FecR protein
MRFRSASGTPLCDGGAAGKDGLVPKGVWLETDAATSVTLDVADIGHVDVAPGSRVRVVETNDKEHRLELGRGHLHAKIDAPPRLFFVDTKAATAIDLGCEYEMEVDAQGAGLLKVKLGYVELEPPTAGSPEERRPPRLVPRGAECTIDPMHGPGTPVWSRSPESLRADLARFDRVGDAVALARVIEALGAKDTLTLFYIVASRAPEAERAAALGKLEAVQKAPAGASRARTLALERRAIQAWREALEPRWFPKEKP